MLDSEFLVDPFFEFYDSDQKFIKNFKITSEIVEKLTSNPKSRGFLLFLEKISFKLDFFESDQTIQLNNEFGEEELKSYTTKLFSNLKLFFITLFFYFLFRFREFT